MAKSARKLRMARKNIEQQLRAAIQKGNDTFDLQEKISGIKKKQRLNAHNNNTW